MAASITRFELELRRLNSRGGTPDDASREVTYAHHATVHSPRVTDTAPRRTQLDAAPLVMLNCCWEESSTEAVCKVPSAVPVDPAHRWRSFRTE